MFEHVFYGAEVKDSIVRDGIRAITGLDDPGIGQLRDWSTEHGRTVSELLELVLRLGDDLARVEP